MAARYFTSLRSEPGFARDPEPSLGDPVDCADNLGVMAETLRFTIQYSDGRDGCSVGPLGQQEAPAIGIEEEDHRRHAVLASHHRAGEFDPSGLQFSDGCLDVLAGEQRRAPLLRF